MATELFALAEPPTAIVTASDVQATGVLEAAQATGRRVPDDVAIVGYDDIELAAHIGLTTVRQPLEVSGQRGAEILLGALAQRSNASPRSTNNCHSNWSCATTTGPAPSAPASTRGAVESISPAERTRDRTTRPRSALVADGRRLPDLRAVLRRLER